MSLVLGLQGSSTTRVAKRVFTRCRVVESRRYRSIGLRLIQSMDGCVRMKAEMTVLKGTMIGMVNGYR
jgi:hypothetical protein